ncbi:hypothetical protein [Alteromonas facilis]|uniref:hypothetical protein n=1 Tax=Alteromonas facilis TaxID=2048004 RepID=UPI000C28A8E6|nr:hypothetical protein [Alteromonas facilis]
MLYRLCPCLLLFTSLFSVAEQPPRTIKYFAADHDTSLFVTDALQLAFTKHNQLKGTELKNIHYLYSREANPLSLLNREIIDIFWDGTSKQREDEYEPVRIPLLRGLLGYRVFLTHKDNLHRFNDISESSLKKLVACQGTAWPDTEILSSNGYTVATTDQFIQLVKLTNKKRCDYFPRAIYEGLNEIQWLADKYPDLRLVEGVMFSYQLPIYLFVRKSDHAFARQLEIALNTAIVDGSYENLFNNHVSLKYLHPISQWQEKRIFTLRNPTLPDSSPGDDKYWVNLKSF